MENYNQDSDKRTSGGGRISGCLALLLYLGFGVGIILAVMLSIRMFQTQDVYVPVYYSILYAVYNAIFIYSAIVTYMSFLSRREEALTMSGVTIGLGFVSGLIPTIIGYFYGLELVVWFLIWFAVWGMNFKSLKFNILPRPFKLVSGVAGAILIACVCLALVVDDKDPTDVPQNYEENPYEVDENDLPYELPELPGFNDSID